MTQYRQQHQQTSKQASTRRRRQWGAERSTQPLAIMHSKPSPARMMAGYIAIVITVLAWLVYVITTVLTLLIDNPHLTIRFIVEVVLYLTIVTTLIFSAFVYLVTRQGALHRFVTHERVPRAQLDEHFSNDYNKSITVLIPSYIEQPKVVEKTLWSAMLQEFPDITVVLLIDDPPDPKNEENRRILDACRHLIPSVLDELEPLSSRFRASREKFLADKANEVMASKQWVVNCAHDYRLAAQWLEHKAQNWQRDDHTDDFFCDQVLLALARDLHMSEQALNESLSVRQRIPTQRVHELYNRLVWIFTAQGWSFERKAYTSTAQEGNKAMNLNSYIALMGHKLKRVETADGVALRDAHDGEYPDLVVLDSNYVLTLDADSMLLRDYCLRLVYQLEQPGNERVAVIQTPYSSYRGAPTRIERIAAATTDIQHMLHQGMTYYDATFWVGANAVIRKAALNDICVVSSEGSRVIHTYIQDRTVIEDTESSIDLRSYDWHLVNYPERLSYSATPPDFGSLVVQRRRWANGGLLIIGKFLRLVRARKLTGQQVGLGEWALRVNYMASIAWSSFGLLLLLAYPFDQRLLSPWVVLASLPYFVTMAQDLHSNGYKRSDIFRIYGFNIVLLTVNLSGTLKSIQQGMSHTKIPFARTPKVRNRTASPGLYVAMPWIIIFYSAMVFYADTLSHNWGNAIFAGFNAIVTLWALVSYIGIGHSLEDMFMGLLRWFFVPVKTPARKREESVKKWEDVLYYGDQQSIYESR